MLTLFTTLISFLTGGLPKLLDFFQDRGDKKQELAILQLQMAQQLELQKAGFQSQVQLEEIKYDEVKLQTASAETTALYAHDMAIGQGASQWVINFRSIVRPAITFGLFGLLVFVDIFGFYYAVKTGVNFNTAVTLLWSQDTQTIWASVVAFWFGTRAFSK